MKIKLSYVLFALILSGSLFAQDSLSYSKNNLYLELLGNGGFGSINYERVSKAKVYFRLGGSVLPASSCSGLDFNRLTYLLITGAGILINIYKDSYLEMGACTTIPIFYERNDSKIILTGVFGYRLQLSDSGFFLRITGLAFYIEHQFYVWPGLSLGYNF